MTLRNSAGFAGVASACFFRPNSETDADCDRALRAVDEYTQRSGDSGLYVQVQNTLRDVRNNDRARAAEKIYQLGYIHFFNADTAYCDRVTLGVYLSNRPGLSQALRRETNRLLENFNRKLEQAVRDLNDPRFAYLDITRAFDGHRFCEPDQQSNNRLTQARTFSNHDDKIWFWAATTAGIFTGSSIDSEQARADGFFMDAYQREDVSIEQREYAASMFNWAATDGQWYRGNSVSGGPSQGGTPGVFLRPFHPTEPGKWEYS